MAASHALSGRTPPERAFGAQRRSMPCRQPMPQRNRLFRKGFQKRPTAKPVDFHVLGRKAVDLNHGQDKHPHHEGFIPLIWRDFCRWRTDCSARFAPAPSVMGLRMQIAIEEKHAMPHEIWKMTAAPSAAIVLAALMTTAAITAPAAAPQSEQKVNEAGAATVRPVGKPLLSSAGAKALHLLGQARKELMQKDIAAADPELGKALGLLDLAQSSLPNGTIRNETWSTRKGALAYREVYIPLNATRRLVTEAQEALRRKDIEAAEAALRAAEDNVVYLSVVVEEPLVKAHHSLWQAARDYAAGSYDAAKSELSEAIGYLDHATQNTDEETHKALQALSEQAQSLKGRMETKSGDVPSRLDELWQRAKAVSERSVEYVAARLQGATTTSGLKRNLIEAKLHLSYAEIARFTADDAEQAAEELGLALSHMDQAVDQASTAQAVQILVLRDGIDALAEEPPTDQKESRYSPGEYDRHSYHRNHYNQHDCGCEEDDRALVRRDLALGVQHASAAAAKQQTGSNGQRQFRSRTGCSAYMAWDGGRPVDRGEHCRTPDSGRASALPSCRSRARTYGTEIAGCCTQALKTRVDFNHAGGCQLPIRAKVISRTTGGIVDLVAKLDAPRSVWLMLPASEAADAEPARHARHLRRLRRCEEAASDAGASPSRREKGFRGDRRRPCRTLRQVVSRLDRYASHRVGTAG